MLNFLKKASAKAQRKNIHRTVTLLVAAADEVDRALVEGRQAPTPLQAKVVKLQRALLGDLIGPVQLEELRKDVLDPLEARSDVSEGAKMAVRHVFNTARKNAS